MVERFKKFVEKENLISSNGRTLLAVSGGVDSVVMCHLFKKAGFDFGIAHCNFKLRGDESDDDAEFVKALSEELEVSYFETSFDTETYASQNKISIQEAARNLRYDWFEKIRSENGFDHIATAHHIDDSLETVLYNFTKGCGIRGLHGILPKKEKIIRPLLFASKKEILEFTEKQNIEYREDASNASHKYARNAIRHQVIPELEKINPSLSKTSAENIQRLRETEQLFNYAIELFKKEVTETKQGNFLIYVQKLLRTPAPATLLYEFLRPYGFNNDQAQQMLQSIENQSGAMFYSKTHEALLDRFLFIVKNNEKPVQTEFLIRKSDTSLKAGNQDFSFEIINDEPDIFPTEKNTAQFDCFQLTFPLRMRRWKEGDSFYPLGMKGKRKKISDLFTDEKISRFDKEQTWILETSQGRICWVVGLRMDDRYKVTENTRQGFRISFSEVKDVVTKDLPI